MQRIALLILAVTVLSAQQSGFDPQYTAAGELVRPKDYREWVFLSSGLGMTYGPAASADAQNSKFDNVFVNPSSYRAFVNTGKWPDKTLFILEIRQSMERAPSTMAGIIRAGS
jgi:hypothetical protein